MNELSISKICETCQGSGYLRKFIGHGEVEIFNSGKIETIKGILRAEKTCSTCNGRGKIELKMSEQ